MMNIDAVSLWTANVSFICKIFYYKKVNCLKFNDLLSYGWLFNLLKAMHVGFLKIKRRGIKCGFKALKFEF